MTIEADLYAAISPIVPRVYPDIAPAAVARPYAVYQQVGGSVVNPIADQAPGTRNARMQIIVSADTRAQAAALMRQIEEALIQSAVLHGRPVSALVARYDDAAQLRGAMQDFTIWHTD